MKQLTLIFLAAAAGSATTYFVMQVPEQTSSKSETPKTMIDSPSSPNPTPQPRVTSETDSVRKIPNQKERGFGGKAGGFLPDEIEGVSPEQLSKCKAALVKSFQNEGIRAARAKLIEIRRDAAEASDEEKVNLRPQLDDAEQELRKVTKDFLLSTDSELTPDSVDKVLLTLEDRMKQRLQQFQQNNKK